MQRRLVRSDGLVVGLTPRLFDALLFFVEHPGQLLDKDTLLGALWPGLVVEENSLSQTISALRRELGDEAQGSRYIQTVPRRGFRFIAAVVLKDDAPEHASKAAAIAYESVEATAIPPPSGGSIERRRVLAWGAAGGASLVIASIGAWWWGSHHRASTPSASTTLAVLPFKPLVLEARDEMLEVGMADSLITRLSNVPGLAVRSVEAKAILDRLRAAERDRFVPPSSIGAIYAGLGDIESALAELERAYAVRDVRLILIKGDGRWKPIREQPRYRAVLEKMKLTS